MAKFIIKCKFSSLCGPPSIWTLSRPIGSPNLPPTFQHFAKIPFSSPLLKTHPPNLLQQLGFLKWRLNLFLFHRLQSHFPLPVRRKPAGPTLHVFLRSSDRPVCPLPSSEMSHSSGPRIRDLSLPDINLSLPLERSSSCSQQRKSQSIDRNSVFADLRSFFICSCRKPDRAPAEKIPKWVQFLDFLYQFSLGLFIFYFSEVMVMKVFVWIVRQMVGEGN